MGRIVFIAIVHVLCGWVLTRLWPGSRRSRVALGLAVGGLVAIVGWLATRPLPGAFATAWRVVSASWMVGVIGTTLLGGSWLALRGLVARARRGRGGPPAAEEVNLARRSFLGRVGGVIPAAALSTGVAGVVTGSSGFVLRRETVRIAGLPRALHGFRIGQLSDVHVGPYVDATDLRRAVEALDAERVDLQVMTGDLIDDLDQLPETMAALASCRARHGLLAILGNHEHWRGAGPVRRAYQQARDAADGRVRLLVDEHHVLEHEGQRLHVVGVDYPMGAVGGAARRDRMERSAQRAFDALPTGSEPILCLAHHPDFFDLAAGRGVALTLAGHTHGGQVGVLGIPIFGFAFRYMVGRHELAGRHLYVSRGTGHWMPFRIGMPTEITVLTLETA